MATTKKKRRNAKTRLRAVRISATGLRNKLSKDSSKIHKEIDALQKEMKQVTEEQSKRLTAIKKLAGRPRKKRSPKGKNT